MATAEGEDLDAWKRKINWDIQLHKGKKHELLFFRVIHCGGEKVLYTSPEEYESIHGTEVDPKLKDQWKRKVEGLGRKNYTSYDGARERDDVYSEDE